MDGDLKATELSGMGAAPEVLQGVGTMGDIDLNWVNK